jgi:3-hydroxymyristoyl/3-hydroxydecanoyl-(acyl carrier protein) dehydratase
VDDFRMLGAVRAGDELRIEVEILRNFGGAILLRGRALVDGELRAEGRITLKPPR